MISFVRSTIKMNDLKEKIMKKDTNLFTILNTHYLILLILIFSACTTDIELEADWKPIPVVYGVLDAQDEVHYLRVERVFQTSGQDAGDIAQLPDSVYYSDEELVVTIEKSNGLSLIMQRVDGNEEGIAREEGAFPTSPNILYKVEGSQLRLEGGEEVQLILELDGVSERITASTTIVEEMSLSNTNPSSPINLGYDRTVRVAWLSGPSTALHQMAWNINYRERLNNGPWEDKVLKWNIASLIEDTPGSSQETFSLKGREFYEFLSRELTADPFIQRQFLGIDIEVLGMGTEFSELLRINNANLGITSFQSENRYSNVEGGIGVLTSSSSTIREDLQLTGASIDSLREGSITERLNFQ